MTKISAALYQKQPSYIPRIAAVHDLCGYGKCSLGVAIPVLSAAGADVCPVPTSLFSAHTLYKTFHMHDTTDMLEPYLDAWQAEGVALDAIYSGFLGAAAQVDAILRLYREYPDALRVVDPVMGDGGKIYPTYTDELCEAMAGLVKGADLLLPNLTEAAILTHTDYQGQDLDEKNVHSLLEKLLDLGAKNVVLKGISRGDGLIRNYAANAEGEVEELSSELLPYMLHGTGDLFASCVLAAIMNGKSLVDAVTFAGDFVREAMLVTTKQPEWQMRGVSFESILGKLTELV